MSFCADFRYRSGANSPPRIDTKEKLNRGWTQIDGDKDRTNREWTRIFCPANVARLWEARRQEEARLAERQCAEELTGTLAPGDGRTVTPMLASRVMDFYSRSFVSIRGYLILNPRSSAVVVGVLSGARPYCSCSSSLVVRFNSLRRRC